MSTPATRPRFASLDHHLRHTTDASFRARLTSASPPSLDPAETPGTTIVLVLETNPEYWRVAGDLDVALRQVLIFVNAHLSLSKRNRVVLIAMHADGKCHYLYEPTEGLEKPGNAETLDPIQCDVGKKALAALAALPAAGKINETSARKKITAPLATALSMAMCYANRQDASQRALSSSSTRIVCVQGSADHSGQYIPVMNCIFSAQRSSIAIDACVLGENNESAFLQQAAHITGGAYYVARDPHELTQRLLTVSSLDADIKHRALRETRNARGVDFRASCFCHKKPLDAGFVCSVCLSVYCDERGACQTCDAKFED